jgi:hypothetical protein
MAPKKVTNQSLFDFEKSKTTKSTKIIDFYALKPQTINASELIDSIWYVELDTCIKATLSNLAKVEIVDTLLYVADENFGFKCFYLNGKYLRECFIKGRAKNEITKFVDFTVDDNYYYILNHYRSVSKYNHNGVFIDRYDLPFVAISFGKKGDYFYFESQGTEQNVKELCKITITDTLFNELVHIMPDDNYLQNKNANYMTSRGNYFGSSCKKYLSTISGYGIYEINGTELIQKYYIKPKKEYNTNNGLLTLAELYHNNYDVLYDNVVDVGNKLIQDMRFFNPQRSRNNNFNLLVIDKNTSNCSFITEIVNDLEDIIRITLNGNSFLQTRFEISLGTYKNILISKLSILNPNLIQISSDELQKVEDQIPIHLRKIFINRNINAQNEVLVFIRFK